MLTAVAAGFCLAVASQVVWPATVWMPLALVNALYCCVGLCVAPANRRAAVAALLGASVGLAWSAWHVDGVRQARLPLAWEGRDVLLTGTINAVRQRADGSVAFVLSVDELPWHARRSVLSRGWGWRVRLGSWQPVPVSPGERWQVPVRLIRPHATLNPGSADFRQYLLGERVVATGYLRDSHGNSAVRVGAARGWMAWRAALLASALPLLGDGPGDIADNDAERFARAVIPALVVDERSLLGADQWRLLADTGTAHLVAISGLHVALLWGALLWIATALLRRRAGSLRYRAAAVLPALLIAAGYASLAGMPLPAARATIMLAAASAFLLRAGAIPAWRALLAATATLLVLDPLSVHAAGFWLSYGAVALLLWLNELHRRPPLVSRRTGWLAAGMAGVRMQVLLSLALAPMLLALFGAASVSSVLANLPAIPMVNFLALPPALAGVLLAPLAPALADPLIDLAAGTMTALWHLLRWIDAWPWLAPLEARGIGAVGVAGLLMAIVAALVVRRATLCVCALLLAGLSWPVAGSTGVGAAQACVLDVGQGLAVLVRTATRAILYDAGPSWGAEGDSGSAVVVPAARSHGVDRLDLLVVSHADPDHAGGVPAVMDALAPLTVLVGDPALRAVTGGRGEPCDRLHHWRMDGVDITVFPGASAGDANDRSCVLRIAAGGRAMLVAGDITRRQELALSARWGDRLRADVLVASGHGSHSGNSLTFLHRVSPRTVIFAAGYRNRFGYPDPRVQARVRGIRARMVETARAGAVCVGLQPRAEPTVSQARDGWPRAWGD